MLRVFAVLVAAAVVSGCAAGPPPQPVADQELDSGEQTAREAGDVAEAQLAAEQIVIYASSYYGESVPDTPAQPPPDDAPPEQPPSEPDEEEPPAQLEDEEPADEVEEPADEVEEPADEVEEPDDE